MKYKVLLFSLTFAIVLSVLLIPVKSAFASSRMLHIAQASAGACITNPGDSNCDGADPTPNCANDGTNAIALYLYDEPDTGSSTTPVALIELRWAPLCQSNWARAYTYTGILNPTNGYTYNYYIYAIKVVRDDGKTEPYGPLNNYTNAWTNMVYAPIRKAEACIQMTMSFTQGGSGPGDTWYCTAMV